MSSSVPLPEVAAVPLSELAARHPVVSIVYGRHQEDAAFFDQDSMQEFIDYELTNNADVGEQAAIPINLTDFSTDYVNYSVVRYLSQHRRQYGAQHFKFDIREVLSALSRLAFLSALRGTKITDAMLLKILPPLVMDVPSPVTTVTKSEQQGVRRAVKHDLEFRTFGIIQKVEETNKRFSYVFRELIVRDYLVALFLLNECHRKIKLGRDGYHVVSGTMRESMKGLPTTGDIWRMAFGLLSDEQATKDRQRHILRELIEEAKLIGELTPFDTTNMCVEVIYESQNAGELTELLDDFTLNQTIRYSNEFVQPTRLQYAVAAVGYMVRSSNNVYGVHMSRFHLNAKNIGMLADPVNDVSDNNLQVLNLSQNPLGPDGMKGLLRFLVKATLLTHLDLGSCQLSNVGVSLLSEFFMCMPLRYLRLADNNITDTGVRHLVRNAKYVATLEWLDLSDNEITDRGAASIGKAMTYLPNLRSLDIQRNKIGDKGVDAISSNLIKLKQVIQLMLGDNQIGEVGANKLSAHIWKSKSIRYVDLNLNNIPAQGIMGLRKAAEEHGELTIAVSSPTNRSEGNLSLTTDASAGEFILESPGVGELRRPPRTTSTISVKSNASIDLLEGRNADFEHRPLQRTWSGRSKYRKSWHESTGSWRRGEPVTNESITSS